MVGGTNACQKDCWAVVGLQGFRKVEYCEEVKKHDNYKDLDL